MKVKAISNFSYQNFDYKQDQVLEVSEEQATFLVGVNAVVVVEGDLPAAETEATTQPAPLLAADQAVPVAEATEAETTQETPPNESTKQTVQTVPTPAGTTQEQVLAALEATEVSSTPQSTEPKA